MEFHMNGEAYQTDLEYGTLNISADEQYGFRPFQLLVSSIAGCSGSTLKKILKKKRIAFDDITIQTEVTRNAEEANRVEKIHLHYRIQGQDLEEKQIEKAIDVARKNCSMVQSVIGSIEVTESFACIDA